MSMGSPPKDSKSMCVCVCFVSVSDSISLEEIGVIKPIDIERFVLHWLYLPKANADAGN